MRSKLKNKYIRIFIILGVLYLIKSCSIQVAKPQAIEEAQLEFKNKNIILHSKVIHKEEHPIHYVKVGEEDKPTLLFVHGSPGGWDAYKDYLNDSILLKNFRMIAIDRPGFGQSDFKKAYNPKAQYEMIHEVLKQENNSKPMHLIGHSLGGPIIVRLAQLYSDKISSITIIAGSISPQAEKPEIWRGIFAYFPLKYLIPRDLSNSNIEIREFKPELNILDKNYDKITMPVMIIHGIEDNLVSFDNVAYGKSKLKHNKNVDTIIFPKEGHFILWTKIEAIRKHLINLKEK